MAVTGNALKTALAAYGVKLVTRAEWGARAPKAVSTIAMPTSRLFVHHTADDRQGASAVRSHQNYHMDTKGWNDIAYHILIGDDGIAFEGRGVGILGGATSGYNSTSHAICFLGNFMGRQPTVASVNTLVNIARCGKDKGWWVPTMHGHRDVSTSSCPGDHLYNQLPTIRTRVSQATQEIPDMIATDFDKIEAIFRKVVNDRDVDGVRGQVERAVQLLGLGAGSTVYSTGEGSVYKNTVTLPQVMAAVTQIEGVDVDEAAIANQVLAGLAPTLAAFTPASFAQAVVAALPPELAQEFVDALAAELNN